MHHSGQQVLFPLQHSVVGSMRTSIAVVAFITFPPHLL